MLKSLIGVRFIWAEDSQELCRDGRPAVLLWWTSPRALGEGENVWGHPARPLAAAAAPPLVKSQKPKALSSHLLPQTLKPLCSAWPLPLQAHSSESSCWCLYFTTFQFTQKILSFVLKKLQIKQPGRHLWTECTHTCLWAVLAANSPYTCCRAALQLICIFLVVWYRNIYRSVLFHGEPALILAAPGCTSILNQSSFLWRKTPAISAENAV